MDSHGVISFTDWLVLELLGPLASTGHNFLLQSKCNECRRLSASDGYDSQGPHLLRAHWVLVAL